MRRLSSGLILLALACTSPEGLDFDDPFEPDDPGRVVGQQGIWSGITMTILAVEDNYTDPRGPGFQPEPGQRLLTLDVQVENRSGSSYVNTMFDFQLALSDNTRWNPRTWRVPVMPGGTMNHGDTVRGWLTFPIPASATPRFLVWEPTFNVALLVPVR